MFEDVIVDALKQFKNDITTTMDRLSPCLKTAVPIRGVSIDELYKPSKDLIIVEKTIKAAKERHIKKENCSKAIIKVFDNVHAVIMLHMDKNNKMVIRDMKLEELSHFINDLIFIISIDMMYFPEHALEWEKFLKSLMNILEDNYNILIQNILMLMNTINRLKDDKK